MGHESPLLLLEPTGQGLTGMTQARSHFAQEVGALAATAWEAATAAWEATTCTHCNGMPCTSDPNYLGTLPSTLTPLQSQCCFCTDIVDTARASHCLHCKAYLCSP